MGQLGAERRAGALQGYPAEPARLELPPAGELRLEGEVRVPAEGGGAGTAGAGRGLDPGGRMAAGRATRRGSGGAAEAGRAGEREAGRPKEKEGRGERGIFKKGGGRKKGGKRKEKKETEKKGKKLPAPPPACARARALRHSRPPDATRRRSPWRASLVALLGVARDNAGRRRLHVPR